MEENKINEFKNNISIKKCQTLRGHDGGGYIQCDVAYKGKVFTEMHEDGWGGGYMYNPTDKEVSDLVFNAFKSFPKEPEYGLDDSLDFLVEELFRKWQQKKEEKKGVLFKTNRGYDIRGAKETIPTTLKKYAKGLEFYQEICDELKSEGKEILNTEYLKSIGIKL